MHPYPLLSSTLCAAMLAVVLTHAQVAPQADRPSSGPEASTPAPSGGDPVAQLAARVAAGTATLTRSGEHGYLPAVLSALGVNPDSQLLVFSKTSLQARLIGPHRPRALYFADGVAVGFVPDSDLLEFAAQDPRRGTVFYTLRQSAPVPVFEQRDSCLSCHVTPRTLDVPGMLTGSVRPSPDGYPLYGPIRTPDHRMPLADRWGGWYVTGSSRQPLHVRTHGTPVTRATDLGDYLSPHSDVAALLVFEHQLHLMNLLTRLGHDWRAGMSRARLDALVAATVDYLLLVDEAPLGEAVRGNSGFAERFSSTGPFDRRGRSLRELDLRSRLFRYPCSFLIYSPAVDALPDAARAALYRRIWAVLSGQASGARYGRLPVEDRRAVVEILIDTRSGLPPEFRPF